MKQVDTPHSAKPRADVMNLCLLLYNPPLLPLRRRGRFINEDGACMFSTQQSQALL